MTDNNIFHSLFKIQKDFKIFKNENVILLESVPSCFLIVSLLDYVVLKKESKMKKYVINVNVIYKSRYYIIIWNVVWNNNTRTCAMYE